MAYQVRQHTGRFPVAARRTTMRLWFWEITAPGSSDRLPFENDAWTHLNLEYQIRQHPVRFPVAARRTTIKLWLGEITAYSGSSYRFAFSSPRKGYVYSRWETVPSSSSYRQVLQVSCSCPRTTVRLGFWKISASGSSHRSAFPSPWKGYSFWWVVPSSSSYRQVSCSCPKNFHQTLVWEVICIWFVTSFCVFISSKRIRLLALMNGTKLIKLQAGFL